MIRFKLLLVLVAVLAALGQVCLKLVARKPGSFMGRFLDPYFGMGIALFLICPGLSIIAARHVDFSVIYSLTALNYVFVMLLGRTCLKEPIDPCKIWGTLIVLAGVLIYNLD